MTDIIEFLIDGWKNCLGKKERGAVCLKCGEPLLGNEDSMCGECAEGFVNDLDLENQHND